MDFEMMIIEIKQVLEMNLLYKSVATALFTNKGNIHVIECISFDNCCNKNDDDYSLNKLIETGETEVFKMVTMFKQGDKCRIEVPCACLCKLIFDMNNDNINTEVLLPSLRIRTYLKEFSFK